MESQVGQHDQTQLRPLQIIERRMFVSKQGLDILILVDQVINNSFVSHRFNF